MPLLASKRIALIKEIAKRLSVESWEIIDLTLKEFSLPWQESWSRSEEAYVIQMIQGSVDESLIGLAEHLGLIDAASMSLSIETNFWKQGKLRVFLSHISEYKIWTVSLQKELDDFGIQAFVAHTDIAPTHEWQDQIERALASCDGLVALLHKGFHASKWTDQEIGFAMGRGVPVFSVRLGEDPYGFIGKLQAFNGISKEPQQVAREIFASFRTNKKTQAKAKELSLVLFEGSNSFACANTAMGYLEEIEAWEPADVERLRTAVKNNSQIRGSWGVLGVSNNL